VSALMEMVHLCTFSDIIYPWAFLIHFRKCSFCLANVLSHAWRSLWWVWGYAVVPSMKGWRPFIQCQDIKEYFLTTNAIMNWGGRPLVVDTNPMLQVTFPSIHLRKEPLSNAAQARIRAGRMENRRSGATRWRQELQDEEYESLVNLVNSLQINMQNASVQWQTTMDLLISQRQGIQQLRDEVDAIHSEVVDLRSRPISPAQPSPSQDVSDAASSPTPPRDSRPQFTTRLSRRSSGWNSFRQCLTNMLCFCILIHGIFYRWYIRLCSSCKPLSGLVVWAIPDRDNFQPDFETYRPILNL
jgi:hypothetical protein